MFDTLSAAAYRANAKQRRIHPAVIFLCLLRPFVAIPFLHLLT